MSREKAFIYIGGSVLIAVLILLFLARPAYQDMLAQKQALDENREELTALKQEIADTRQLKSDYESTPEDQVADVDAHIPPTHNEAEFVAQMEEIGKTTEALVTEINFNIRKEEEKEIPTLDEVSVRLTATGSYESLFDFVASLEQNKRILNLRDVSLVAEGSELIAQIDLVTYFKDAGLEVEDVLSPQDDNITF